METIIKVSNRAVCSSDGSCVGVCDVCFCLLSGHYEAPPYDPGSLRSAYHVKSCDVFCLKQVCLFACLSVCLFVSLFIYASVCVFVCQCVCLSV